MLSFANPLLAWFYENRRSLPFREDPTPYHVWISEIMLQQTRMTAVLPYYDRFIRELPTPADLAACDTDRLHKLWEGLGYYSRADNLKRAAEVICAQYGGRHRIHQLRNSRTGRGRKRNARILPAVQ